MSELNRDEIIKALKRKQTVAFLSGSAMLRFKDIETYLALINQLTEENENWEAIAEGYRKQFEDCAEERAKLTEENERLKSELRQTTQKLNTVICLNDKLTADNEWIKTRRMPEEKTETIRKMQFRLCQHFCRDPAFLGVEKRLIMGVIDQIAKEMEEGVCDT